MHRHRQNGEWPTPELHAEPLHAFPAESAPSGALLLRESKLRGEASWTGRNPPPALFPMHATRCRAASLADVAAMAELRDASGWSGGAGAGTMERYLAGTHHPREALAPRAVFVAEDAGALAGFIAGHRTTRFGCAGELQWLLVSPACRAGPVAAELLAALAAWMAGESATRVCVNVAPENLRARRFYARHGAAELSQHWMVWPDITVAAHIPSGAT